jgi:hypothetical protein
MDEYDYAGLAARLEYELGQAIELHPEILNEDGSLNGVFLEMLKGTQESPEDLPDFAAALEAYSGFMTEMYNAERTPAERAVNQIAAMYESERRPQ